MSRPFAPLGAIALLTSLLVAPAGAETYQDDGIKVEIPSGWRQISKSPNWSDPRFNTRGTPSSEIMGIERPTEATTLEALMEDSKKAFLEDFFQMQGAEDIKVAGVSGKVFNWRKLVGHDSEETNKDGPEVNKGIRHNTIDHGGYYVDAQDFFFVDKKGKPIRIGFTRSCVDDQAFFRTKVKNVLNSIKWR